MFKEKKPADLPAFLSLGNPLPLGRRSQSKKRLLPVEKAIFKHLTTNNAIALD
jgi:hypothetical protein